MPSSWFALHTDLGTPGCISEHTGTFLYEEKDGAHSKVRQEVFMALQVSNGL